MEDICLIAVHLEGRIVQKRRAGYGNEGFTLVEMLLVTVVLVVLFGISVTAVIYYRNYLKISELDNAARELYMAAENRAVLLANGGQLEGLVLEEGRRITVPSLGGVELARPIM